MTGLAQRGKYLVDGPGGPGWYMFVEGECVSTPHGTGFIVAPLDFLGPAGWTCCYVRLDGHEDEDPYLGTCSTDNIWGQDVVSVE